MSMQANPPTDPDSESLKSRWGRIALVVVRIAEVVAAVEILTGAVSTVARALF